MSMPAGLRDLIAAVAAGDSGSAPAEPPYLPEPGQSPDDWLTAIADARRVHDEFAIRRRAAAEARSGHSSVAELLGVTGPTGLRRSRITLTVPNGTQLDDVVPQLHGLAPAGPPARTSVTASDVALTISSPVQKTGSRPCILRLHGGAFWMGGGATSTILDRVIVEHLAARTGAVVIEVDYRLAPEHPFPAPIVDALLALDLVRRRTDELGIDTARIAFVGTSSGGNTATIATRVDALRGAAPPLAALGLVVPSVDLTAASSSMRADEQAWGSRLRQVRAYLGEAIELTSPYVSPSLADRLTGMPPTFAAVAEYDEIAHGSDALCSAIVAGGGEAMLRRYPMTHTIATPEVEAASLRELADFLVEAFARA